VARTNPQNAKFHEDVPCSVEGCDEVSADGVELCVYHDECPYCGEHACDNPHEDD
jgi:hypothetical protein